MARSKTVCEAPTITEKMMAKLQGRKAKQKCTKVKVDKDKANSIASKINWGGKG